MITYLIVGSGYRAEYFGRVAKTYPDIFRAMFLCRSQIKADALKERTGIRATVKEKEALAFHPDYVVIAVDRGHMAEVASQWVRKGFPVLMETPVGETEEQLQMLWSLVRDGAQIAGCEQYHRQPLLAQGLKMIEDGYIGEPSSMYISLVHDYHAASLIRRALQIPLRESYTVYGWSQDETVTETDSRNGAILDGRETTGQRMMAQICFDSGKQAIYDFCPVQYRSFIRSRHLTVRGIWGEWNDNTVSWVDENNLPARTFLLPEIGEKYRCLDTQALRDRRRNWQGDLAPDTVQDEFAIATILLDMMDYVHGGEPPYSLEESIADARFWFSLQLASEHPHDGIRMQIGGSSHE